jgi:valyl-tRNA synthetase
VGPGAVAYYKNPLRSGASGDSHQAKLIAVLKAEASLVPIIQEAGPLIQRMAQLAHFTVAVDAINPGKALAAVGQGFVAYLPVEDLVDIQAEARRLQGEADKLKKVLQSIGAKLNNPAFVARAPADVVAENQMKQAQLQLQLTDIQANIDALG